MVCPANGVGSKMPTTKGEVMTREIPKEKWPDFFADLSENRSGWETIVGALPETVGDRFAAEGLALDAITFTAGTGQIEISVGQNPVQHESHKLADPVKVAYLDQGDDNVGVLEIEGREGTKTLVKFLNPMRVYIGYTN
jgi:hypothetical protein